MIASVAHTWLIQYRCTKINHHPTGSSFCKLITQRIALFREYISQRQFSPLARYVVWTHDEIRGKAQETSKNEHQIG